MTITSEWLRFGPAHWALIDQAVVSAATFAVGVLLARALDPEGLALYSLAITTVLCLTSVHRALVAQPLNILGAQELQGQRLRRYSNMLRLQGGMLPVMALLAIVVGWMFFPVPSLMMGAAVYAGVFALQDLIRRYHYTDGQIQRAVPGDVLAFGGQGAALALLVVFAWPVSVSLVFWWLMVPLVVSALWMHRLIRRSGQPAKAGSGVIEHLAEHWANARWVVLSQLVWIGASQLIPFQLATYAKSQDVAAYHAANALMNALNVFRLTLGNYLPGRSARVFADGGAQALRMYLRQVSLACLGLAFVVFVFFELTGDFWVDWLFAGKYQEAKPVVSAMVLVHLLAMSALISAAGAQVMGTTRVMFWSNAVALALTLTLGSWFIHVWGLWGAVVALAIGLLLPAMVQGVHLSIHFRSRLGQV
jgi:O-antigen/teichoic acid export membrane protein